MLLPLRNLYTIPYIFKEMQKKIQWNYCHKLLEAQDIKSSKPFAFQRLRSFCEYGRSGRRFRLSHPYGRHFCFGHRPAVSSGPRMATAAAVAVVASIWPSTASSTIITVRGVAGRPHRCRWRPHCSLCYALTDPKRLFGRSSPTLVSSVSANLL